MSQLPFSVDRTPVRLGLGGVKYSKQLQIFIPDLL